MATQLDPPVCRSCDFRNLPVAIFCGSCGQLLDGIACDACGFSNPKNNHFCNRCDSSLNCSSHAVAPSADSDVPSEPSVSPAAATRSLELNSRPALGRQVPATPTLLGIPASLGAFLSAKRGHLLASGTLIVILAQLGLYFSVEPNTKAPLGYLLLLALGVALFACGSAGLWVSRTTKALDPTNPAFPAPSRASLGNLRSGMGIAALLIGSVSTAILLSMLAAGLESGNTIFPWLVSLLASAALFAPQLANAPSVFHAPLLAWLGHYRWDLLVVASLVGVFLAINLVDLTNWYYSAIGDEYLFYEHSKRVIDEGIVRPFSQDGVYNKHPVMNSIFQAAVMRVFGADYFGWTFSEVLNAALTIPAIYLLGRVLGGRSAAIAAAAIFAFSHYVFAFSHTGYTNLSPLPVTAWALALFLLGWRNGNPLLLYIAGVVAGFGFYTHYSGRAILPVILLFTIAVGRPKRLIDLWPLAVGFVLTVAPTFVVEQEGVVTRMFGQVVGGYSETVTGSAGQRLLGNVELNLQAFNYNPTVHTYVYGPLLDPLSGILAALGIAFALGHIREIPYRLLLIWFAVAVVMTGILSPYPHVAITRLLFAVPPVALLAGLLVGRLFGEIPGQWPPLGGLPKSAMAGAILAILIPAVLLLNLWQFWHVTPTVHPHSQEAVAVGAFRSAECSGDIEGTIFVGHATGEGSLMRQVLTAFSPDDPLPHQADYFDLAEGAGLPEVPLKCVIFVNPGVPDAYRLQDELARRYPEGRLSTFVNPSGTTAVEIFSRQ